MDDSNSPEENETEESVIPGYANVNEFSQQTLKAVLQATRSSNDLPVGDDFDFYSTFRSVRDVMDIEGQRILALLQRILRHQNVKGSVGQSSALDLEDRFDVLMDANDQILERAGTLLDEASGVKKQEAKLILASTPRPKVSTSWNKKVVTPTNTAKAASAYRLLTARNIQRPQLRFKDKIDNSNCPFKPFIREKPNALKSLEESLRLSESVTLEDSEKPDFVHPHPYAYELQTFTPSTDILTKVKPQEPQPISLTPLIQVNTVEQLQNLLKDLQDQKEIAVDLEHHSYRSFLGLTCLMQISTRSRDYIVDTLDLREELQVLNKVFTDPKITKVFHGANSDINWLQRDLGLYVVNLFDTGQAAKVLGLARFSLAHLLMQYCQVEADKQFQLADWRIRPLPEELINYAREDTHYLLYIYDMMRNQLLDSGNQQANLLQSVYSRSSQIALQVYHKLVFSEQDHLELYKKSRKTFNNQQLAALKELYRWRDHHARLEDESTGYVLPNHMLMQIAEILPREQQGVLACCNPIPPLVRQNLPELHKIVLQAREIAVTKMEKYASVMPSEAQHPKYDADSLLNCHHDMTRQGEIIANIEMEIAETGLIAEKSTMFQEDSKANHIQLKRSPVISAFSPYSKSQKLVNGTQGLVDNIKALFSNPFTKFLVKDMSHEVILKPANEEMWVLKRSTQKRKQDNQNDNKVDLDSFEPEYAPPTKKSKVTVNLTSSAKPAGGATGSIFGVPDLSANSSKSEKEDIRQKITSKLQTLRDEVCKAKKRLKEKEEEKKNTNNNKDNSQEEKKGEKETPVVISNAVSDRPDDKKKKKRNKKKDKGVVKEEIQAFDYAAAEEQMKKDASQAKKIDVYNPLLPNLDKKKGKGNKGKGGKVKSKFKGKGKEKGEII